MIPCLNGTVPKRWNCWQKLMTTQTTDTVSASVCSHWDGQMAYLPCRSLSVLLSSENKKNGSMRPPLSISGPQGTGAGCSMQKGTLAMPEPWKVAKKAAIPASYVLFDSWFSSPSTLHAVKSIGYDVDRHGKKTPKMFFRYNGEDMSLISIYGKNKRDVDVPAVCLLVRWMWCDGESIPAKVVCPQPEYGRNTYAPFVPIPLFWMKTIIRIYGKRWISKSFQGMQSYLNPQQGVHLILTPMTAAEVCFHEV